MEWVQESSCFWDRLRHSPSFSTAQTALVADVGKVEAKKHLFASLEKGQLHENASFPFLWDCIHKQSGGNHDLLFKHVVNCCYDALCCT